MARIMGTLRWITSSSNKRQVVFITGCDSGLGYSLARRCQIEGLTVVAGCLDSTGPGAKELADLGVKLLNLDVTKRDSITTAAGYVNELLKENNYQLQAVVNNAGVMVFGEFEWQTPNLMERQLAINVLGYMNVAYEFLPILRTHKGRLMNIVSHCALAGLPSLSVYGATKAAVLNWSDTMRIEQGKYGIKVVSVIPGSFFGESNIMAKQNEYADEMIHAMSTERRQFHENYFHIVQKYLSQLPAAGTPKPMTDEKLYQKLLHGLLSSSPKAIYKHEPFRYSVYHTLFKLLPIGIRDRMVERFVRFPSYMERK